MQRREFLAAAGASLAAAAVKPARFAIAAPAAPAPPWRVIDTHLHVFNTALEGQGDVPQYLGRPATVEEALAAMDYGRVERAFLISYSAADVAVQIRQRGFDPDKLGGVLSKEYQSRAAREHPDRFWWFTDHVDPSRPSYLEDLEADFEAGAAGVKLLPWFHGYLADHPGFLAVYELCRRRRRPVILDVSWWYFHLNPLYRESAARRRLVQSAADYAKLLAPVFREFADVPFSLAHAGTAKAADDYRHILPLIAAHPNVSCDLAAATDYGEALIERLVAAAGAHKVMYGTDWPYWAASGPRCYREDERRWGLIADGCPALDDRARRLVLTENAERFVRCELPDGEDYRGHRLHRESLVAVIHDHRPLNEDVAALEAGGVTVKVHNVGVDVEIGRDYLASAPQRKGWAARTQAALEEALAAIEAAEQQLVLARNVADINEARRDGRTAIVLGVEGGKLLEGKLENLARFYEQGLRELQLRWAVPNQLVEADELTDFGFAVVRECQRLGLIVDLTHIPQRAFDQAIEAAQRPMIVSHGTPSELGPRRVEAIARLRGVVGIHFYSSYLGERPGVGQALDAIEQLVAAGGIETVALGIDLFPTDGPWREFQEAQGTRDLAWAVPSLAHLEEVTCGLVARGFDDESIRAILGENFLRVCREVWSA